MKLELLSEKKLSTVVGNVLQEIGEFLDGAREVSICRLAAEKAARAALEELEVQIVLNVPSSPSARACHKCAAWDVHESCCALSNLCPSEGAILVRAKERS